jgi:cob(I)alamin adenosyltransferase
MGNRLSKIYTRTGDDGTTGLGDGTRVAKDSARVSAYGTVDELNSAIGLVLAGTVPERIREVLTQAQHDLFDLGGELCIPGMAMVEDADVTRLEGMLDAFNETLPPLKDFILPGGGMAAAHCHLARTICRRAEREVITLSRIEDVRGEAIRYLNRLSDLLFVLARVLARESGHGEVLWSTSGASAARRNERRRCAPLRRAARRRARIGAAYPRAFACRSGRRRADPWDLVVASERQGDLRSDARRARSARRTRLPRRRRQDQLRA